jgi:hypothetical protein
MSGSPGSEFSFDLYPGVNSELDAALARNVQRGNATPEVIAAAGIAAAVQQSLEESASEVVPLSSNEHLWADNELNHKGGALDKWQKYGHILNFRPASAGEMENSTMGPARYGEVIERLHSAKEALQASGEVTPTGGENIGDTMHLVVVPWEMFRDNLGDLEVLMKQFRNAQGINKEDYIGQNIIKSIKGNHRFYKSWDAPGIVYTAAEYLDHKIKEDGPWGLMLTQTSDEPGVKSLLGQSPDELTGRANHTPVIADQEVGSFGLFEWLALTLQEDPRHLSAQYYSWMLANRTEVTGGPRGPYGRWGGARVRSDLNNSDGQDENARPRLAVM